MTDAPTRWIDPNPPQQDNSRTTAILAASGVLLTVVVVATLVAVVLNATSESATKTKDGILVAANIPTAAPFTRPIVVAPTVIADQVQSDTLALLQQIPVRANRGVRPVSGLQPRLYGATGKTDPCDIVTLANDLDTDPATAQAWGLALGLKPQQLPYYLNTLTPVILMADTWVTIAELVDGDYVSKQAVLQAGNAILIDPIGVPRTHCASGAPLTPPAEDTLAHYDLRGDKWPEFNPLAVVAVQYSAAATSPQESGDFVLVDITSGEPVTRKPGGTIELGGTPAPLPDPAIMNVPPDEPISTKPSQGER